MPAQAGIQFPCPRLLDSRLRGNDARIQVLAVYLRNGHLGSRQRPGGLNFLPLKSGSPTNAQKGLAVT